MGACPYSTHTPISYTYHVEDVMAIGGKATRRLGWLHGVGLYILVSQMTTCTTKHDMHYTTQVTQVPTCARAAKLWVGNTDGALVHPCSTSRPCCPIRHAREAALQSPRRNMIVYVNQLAHTFGSVEIHSTHTIGHCQRAWMMSQRVCLCTQDDATGQEYRFWCVFGGGIKHVALDSLCQNHLHQDSIKSIRVVTNTTHAPKLWMNPTPYTPSSASSFSNVMCRLCCKTKMDPAHCLPLSMCCHCGIKSSCLRWQIISIRWGFLMPWLGGNTITTMSHPAAHTHPITSITSPPPSCAHTSGTSDCAGGQLSDRIQCCSG